MDLRPYKGFILPEAREETTCESFFSRFKVFCFFSRSSYIKAPSSLSRPMSREQANGLARIDKTNEMWDALKEDEERKKKREGRKTE